jgi:GGDEF domain-containing protein
VDNYDVIENMAEKCLSALKNPIVVEDREYTISASIGVAKFPEDGADPDTLLEHADMAMYRAKRNSTHVDHYSDKVSEPVD